MRGFDDPDIKQYTYMMLNEEVAGETFNIYDMGVEIFIGFSTIDENGYRVVQSLDPTYGYLKLLKRDWTYLVDSRTESMDFTKCSDLDPLELAHLDLGVQYLIKDEYCVTKSNTWTIEGITLGEFFQTYHIQVK